MTWLDQLEQELDQRLASFLRNNPVQEQLFREQHQRDRVRALQRQRQQSCWHSEPAGASNSAGTMPTTTCRCISCCRQPEP